MAKTNNQENKFIKEQRLRHPLAAVSLINNQVKINQQLYQIVVNKEAALNLDILRQKYDPYLDQYDFLVGDIASDHLRLKGFYHDHVHTAIDRKEQTIADYLMEYCNPGGAYFILQLVNPVHHYHNRRDLHSAKRNVHATAFKYHKTNRNKAQPTKRQLTTSVARTAKRHPFVIKKRKDNT